MIAILLVVISLALLSLCMYLIEGDEESYVCNVSILQTIKSVVVELGPLIGTHWTMINYKKW